MASHSSTLAWKIPWTEEPGRLQSMRSLRVGHDWATSLLTFHFHALEKEMATHSSILAWRIPGTGEPGGLPSMGLHKVGHDWSDLAAATEPKVDVYRVKRDFTYISCVSLVPFCRWLAWSTDKNEKHSTYFPSLLLNILSHLLCYKTL